MTRRRTPAPTRHTSDVTSTGLVLFDVERRTFLGLSSDGTYYHHVTPATPDMWVVRQGKRQAGQLTCVTCEGGRTHGWCYRVIEAEAFEQERENAAWAAIWGEEPTAAQAVLA